MKQKAPPLSEVALHILHNKTLRQLIIGSTLVVTVGYGALLGCQHISCVLTMTTIGVGQMTRIGIGGGIGTALGGHFAELGKRDVRWDVADYSIGTGGLPFSVGAYLATDLPIVLLAFPVSVGALISGPLAMLHTLVKPEMRSLASAILLFINNIIGLGWTPLIGVLSDYFQPTTAALPYAMVTSALLAIWASFHLWLAAGSTSRY